MKKRKSIHKTKDMIQTAVWLPRSMHDQLKIARGLGEEVRRRLRSTFDAESRDRITDELVDAIRQIEGRLSPEEPWHVNHFAFDVFKTAINELLSNYRPAEPGHRTATKLQAEYGPEEKPETIGRILARIAFKDAVAKRSSVETQEG